MSGTVPDNNLLHWLQDKSNDNHRTTDKLGTMFAFFDIGYKDPIKLLKNNGHHHCFLIFKKNKTGASVCMVLHHLAQVSTQMGHATPYDGNWYVNGDQPVGGTQFIYELPDTLFNEVPEVQCYTRAWIQQEIVNKPDASRLDIVVDDDNLADLELITTLCGKWIPNPYAALCLDENLSPVDTCNMVTALCVAHLFIFYNITLWGSQPLMWESLTPQICCSIRSLLTS